MYNIFFSNRLITLTVFAQKLYAIKKKAISQQNEENEYIGKNNESFLNLSLLYRPLPQPPLLKI